jgi:hypothetical protein
MKEYIKPDAELIEYSFADIIAGSSEPSGDLEDRVPGVEIPGEDSGGFFD